MPKSRKRSLSKPTPIVAAQQRAAASKPVHNSPRADSKEAKVIALLRRPAGATIDQMVKLTGWQPHTVRGVLSGALKKKRGMTIVSDKPEGKARIYRLP